MENPSYRQVSGGSTGHQESVLVRFDDSRVNYAALLRAYWRNIDPFNGAGQFCDRGDSYRAVIFSDGPAQANEARRSLQAAARELGKPAGDLKVGIQPLQRFWPAEEYHQNYADRNPLRYGYYRWSCGRDQRLDAVWGERARKGVAWLQPRRSDKPRASLALPGRPPRSS
ncbi:MAG: peptide-methionine (S)-S-oxide reductase [Synechococcaceae cyanobacterium]